VLIELRYLWTRPLKNLAGILTPGGLLELGFMISGSWCVYVLFRRPSIAASALVFAMVLVEVGARFIDLSVTDSTIPILALLFSVQALRGSLVAKKL